MSTFFGEQVGVVPFVGESLEEPKKATPPSMTAELATSYSHHAGKPAAELKRDIEVGLEPVVRSELSNKENAVQTAERASAVDRILTEQGDPDEAAAMLTELMSNTIFKDHVSPELALAMGTRVGQVEKRAIERSIAAQRIIDERIENQSGGFWSTLGYFADYIVSEPINNIVGAVDPTETILGGGEQVRLAREASDLLFADISADEFHKQFNAILDRAADNGLFSEDNPFAVEQFLGLVAEYGYGPESNLVAAFQGLDVVLAAPSTIANVVKGSRGLSKLPTLMSKTEGNEVATKAITQTVDAMEDSAIVVENTASAMITPARSEHLVSPELKARRIAEGNNAALASMRRFDFGSYVDPEEAQKALPEWKALVDKQNEQYKNHELNYHVEQGDLNNYRGIVTMGKYDGTPFVSKVAADKFAAKVGGEVVPQTYNSGTAYVVRKEYNLPTKGKAAATELSEINSSWIHSIMSTTARTSADLDARLKQAEAQVGKAVKELGAEYLVTRKKMGRTEMSNIDSIFREYRDDPNFNKLTQAPSTADFRARWVEKYHEPPRQEVLDYYDVVADINEVDYFLQADILFKDAVNNGEEMVKIGDTFYRGVPSKLDEGDLVYDPRLGQVVPYTKGKVHTLATSDFETEAGAAVKHVLSDGGTTRRIYHSDVLEYNFGGHRAYTTRTPFFLKQTKTKDVATGKRGTVESVDRTFASVRLEAEALKAVDEINTVIKNVDELPVRQLDSLVLANNNWNLNIENFDDFVKFFDEHDLDISSPVSWAGDGERVNDASYIASPGVSDFYNRLNSSKGRSNKPLVGYGGDVLDTLDPIQSIERGFAASISRHGEQRYLFNAIEGWHKAALKTNSLQNVPAEAVGNAKAILDLAIENPSKYLRSTETGKALKAEMETIRFRLNNTTADIRWLQDIQARMADAVYGWGYKGLAHAMERASLGHVPSFMRSIAFTLKLGLWAIDQLVVQASQAVQIVSQVPKYGVQASAAAWAMRAAMAFPHPNNIKAMGEIVSKFSNMTPDEFVNLVAWVKKTGRDVVDRTVVEENNSAVFYNSTLKRIVDTGRIPFNEGEKIARLTAAAANFMERKAAHGAEDIFNEHVTRQMIRRQDILTASMTAASAAPWQKSMLGVPLQFTTFQMRMLEQVMVSGVLTPAQRVRLAVGQLIFYGAAGIPMAGWVADKFAYEKGIQADNGLFNTVRYGMIDATLSLISGTDTAIASRIAPGEGIWDMWAQVFTGEKSAVEFVGGPSTQVARDAITAFAGLGKALFQPNSYKAPDVAKFARNFKAADLAYNAWVAHKYSVLTSRKTGAPVVEDLSSVDAVMLGLGIPLRDVDQAWTTIGFIKSDEKKLKKHSSNIAELMRTADALYAKDDYDGYDEVLRQVNLAMSILTPHEQKQVLKLLRFRNTPVVESIFQQSIRKGNLEAANRVGGNF